jgi:hypothetical protein
MSADGSRAIETSTLTWEITQAPRHIGQHDDADQFVTIDHRNSCTGAGAWWSSSRWRCHLRQS